MPQIIFFRPTLGQGGADRVTVTLLQELDRKGIDVALVLVRAEGEYLQDLPPSMRVHSLDASRVATALVPLLRLLEKEQPSVLFSTASGTNSVAVLANRFARKKCRLVLSERNVLLHGRITFKKRGMLLLKRLLYAYADQIIVVSEGVKVDLVRRLNLDTVKISVVYNPIVTAELATLAQTSIEHPWFHENVPVALGVGRLVIEKDFPTLLRAFARVRAQRNARLIILGEGLLRAELHALACELGIEKDFALPGFDKNPFKYMSRCSAFVLSSRFEGLPGVLIQAMACGAPVISTDCPAGPSEIITPNLDGILVPVGDVEQMANALETIFDDPLRAKEMGRRAQQSAQRFRVDRVLERYTAALLGQI